MNQEIRFRSHHFKKTGRLDHHESEGTRYSFLIAGHRKVKPTYLMSPLITLEKDNYKSLTVSPACYL